MFWKELIRQTIAEELSAGIENVEEIEERQLRET
jgi:hypothetical protein